MLQVTRGDPFHVHIAPTHDERGWALPGELYRLYNHIRADHACGNRLPYSILSHMWGKSQEALWPHSPSA
jgi:hypothetical protein